MLAWELRIRISVHSLQPLHTLQEEPHFAGIENIAPRHRLQFGDILARSPSLSLASPVHFAKIIFLTRIDVEGNCYSLQLTGLIEHAHDLILHTRAEVTLVLKRIQRALRQLTGRRVVKASANDAQLAHSRLCRKL